MRKMILPALLTLSLIGCTHNSEQPEVVKETYLHRYGVEVNSKDWNQRGANGKVVSTLRNGVVVSRTYAEGRLHGLTVYSFPHSEVIQKTEDYNEGVLAREIYHFSSGEPKMEVAYRPTHEKTIACWYDNGKTLSNETYSEEKLIKGVYYSFDQKVEASVENGNGERIRRDVYGNLLSRDQVADGYLTTVTTYHSNGTPREVTPYAMNVVQGLKRSYLPDGEPNTLEEWYDGAQTGITTLYQNGEKIAEIPYLNGTKNGVERRYANGKKVVEEITWVNGAIHGPYNTVVGDKIQTDWYHRGKRVSKNTFETMQNKAA